MKEGLLESSEKNTNIKRRARPSERIRKRQRQLQRQKRECRGGFRITKHGQNIILSLSIIKPQTKTQERAASWKWLIAFKPKLFQAASALLESVVDCNFKVVSKWLKTKEAWFVRRSVWQSVHEVLIRVVLGYQGYSYEYYTMLYSLYYLILIHIFSNGLYTFSVQSSLMQWLPVSTCKSLLLRAVTVMESREKAHWLIKCLWHSSSYWQTYGSTKKRLTQMRTESLKSDEPLK